jgi:hypothetical protein
VGLGAGLGEALADGLLAGLGVGDGVRVATGGGVVCRGVGLGVGFGVGDAGATQLCLTVALLVLCWLSGAEVAVMLSAPGLPPV